MSDKKRNALAELAERLEMYRSFHNDDDRLNDNILTKAKRIV